MHNLIKPRSRIMGAVDRVLPGVAVIIVCFVLAFAIRTCQSAAEVPGSVECPDNSDECWNKYSKEASKGVSEAGKPTLEPPKKTVKDGLINGMKWCMNPKSKCYHGIRARLEKRYKMYKAWWDKYSGARKPRHQALTSCTEAPVGPAQCSPDKSLEECGLMGIKESQAEACNVNVCDPESSIWCAGYFANKRMLKVAEKYPAIMQAPRDWYMISGFIGGLGTMGYILVKDSGAVSTNDDGTLRYKSPYNRVVTWLKWVHAYKPENIGKMMVYGRFKEEKLGFRVGRVKAVLDIVEEYHADGLTFSTPVLIPRPTYLPEFPGMSAHGKCDKFPEMLKRVPATSQ